jgi:hypothetical protein
LKESSPKRGACAPLISRKRSVLAAAARAKDCQRLLTYIKKDKILFRKGGPSIKTSINFFFKEKKSAASEVFLSLFLIFIRSLF